MDFFSKSTFLVLVFVILAHQVGVYGSFVVETGNISVLYPMSIRAKHECAIGNFALPDYGGSLVGSVAYPEKGSKGCKAFEGDKPYRSRKSRPTIVVLDRGDCYFALKLWNAQEAGASAVLVVDDFEEPLFTMNFPDGSPHSDKYRERIGIPSALIKKAFGDSLKKAAKNGEDLVVKFEWKKQYPTL